MNEEKTSSTRRDFLSRSTVAATLGATAVAAGDAAQNLKPSIPARSASRVVGANERIHVGIIGVGLVGAIHLRAFMQQTDEEWAF